MKRTSGDRSKNGDVLTRKRALIRSLIEETGWQQPSADPTGDIASRTQRKLAPIIPFPVDGRLEVET
jgi:hypothetical protein